MKQVLAFGALLSLVVSAAAFGANCPNVGFSLKQTFTGYPYYVEDLQTIDYDHDGKRDLVGRIVQAGPSPAILYTWHGLGDGTFEDAVSLGDSNITDLQVADVNNDGYEDIVAASSNNAILVRLGNAAGGFNTAIQTATNYSVSAVSVGNFNEGNVNIDLVTSSLSNGLFVVYQGNGDGTFSETRRVTLDSSNWVTDSVAADFDNDGRIDVAVSRRMTQKVEVYFRNADGTFASPVILPAGNWPQHIESGDFNEDGLPDIASINWDWTDGTLDLYQAVAGRTFTRQTFDPKLPGNFGGAEAIRIVDIDADGHLDVLVGGVNGQWLTTFIGRGDGGFLSPSWLQLTDSVFSIAVGNFDADGDLEAAAGAYQKMWVFDYSCTPQTYVYAQSPVITTGYTAKFRATVSGISTSTPLPRGNVAFKEGNTILGVVDVEANGKAALDYSGLTGLGQHTITANFSGNSTVGASTASTTVTLTNSTSSTTVNVGASTHGEPFNSTVTVGGTSGPGFYLLTLDGVTESKPRWSGQPLTLTLSAGGHTLSAEFIGDIIWPASTSPTYSFTTAKHAVSVTKSGDTTVREGTSHTIQIGVSATTSPVPAGSITLYRGATQIGSGALVNGVASITATLPRGLYDCSAVYSGDTYYLTGSAAFKLDVVANQSLAIDAHGFDSNVYIAAVVPQGTTAAVMYRSLRDNNNWSVVPSWSLASPYDDGSGMVRGFPYDYRLTATVAGQPVLSNIDATLLYNDPTIVAGTTRVRIKHFSELQDAVNHLRRMAGLPVFVFDGTIGEGLPIRASHLTALRTAVDQARAQLGMLPMSYTDPALTANMPIRAAHVIELRDAAR